MPRHAGHPRTQNRQKTGRLLDPLRKQGADTSHLVLLDVEEKHVGGIVADLEREGAEQVRLDRVNPDDEEAAQPDRQQDHPRLVAGSRQVEHGVSQREPRPGAERLDHPHQPLPPHVQHNRHEGEPPTQPEPDLPRRGLPAGQHDEHDREHRDDHGLDPVPRGGRDEAPAQQRQRLDGPHLEQRTQCEQQRHDHPDTDPLRHRRRPQPVGQITQSRRRGGLLGQRRRNGGQRAAGQRDPQQRTAQPQRHHLQHVDRQHLFARRAETLQDGDTPDPLLHEDPGNTPDPDPPQDHDHESDQTQVVFGAQHVRGDPVLGLSVGPDPDECVT